ncbi:hypothetical protein ABPG77_010477 [Micractinium sp. CCAP 211/92]
MPSRLQAQVFCTEPMSACRRLSHASCHVCFYLTISSLRIPVLAPPAQHRCHRPFASAAGPMDKPNVLKKLQQRVGNLEKEVLNKVVVEGDEHKSEGFPDSVSVVVLANALTFAAEPLYQAQCLLSKVKTGTDSAELNSYLYVATVLLQSVLDSIPSSAQTLAPLLQQQREKQEQTRQDLQSVRQLVQQMHQRMQQVPPHILHQHQQLVQQQRQQQQQQQQKEQQQQQKEQQQQQKEQQQQQKEQQQQQKEQQQQRPEPQSVVTDKSFLKCEFACPDFDWILPIQDHLSKLQFDSKTLFDWAHYFQHERAWVGCVTPHPQTAVKDVHDEKHIGFVYGMLVPAYNEAKGIVCRLAKECRQIVPALYDL